MKQRLLGAIQFGIDESSYGAVQLIETGTLRVVDEIVGDLPEFVQVVNTPEGPRLVAAEPGSPDAIKLSSAR